MRAFYKEILDDKDATNKEYCALVNGTGSENSKVSKRLLIKFRSEQELRAIKDLRESLQQQKELNEAGVTTEDKAETEDVAAVERDIANKADGSSVSRNAVENQGNNSGNEQNNKRLCRDGKMCRNIGHCSFRHDVINKPSRYGGSCKKMERCLFIHRNASREESGSNGFINMNRS